MRLRFLKYEKEKILISFYEGRFWCFLILLNERLYSWLWLCLIIIYYDFHFIFWALL